DAISGERRRAELERILEESEPNKSLSRLSQWNVLHQESIGLEFDEWFHIAWDQVGFRAARENTGQDSSPEEKDEKFRLARAEIYWIILACRAQDLDALGRRLALQAPLIALIWEGQRVIGLLDEVDRPLKPSDAVSLLETRGPVPLQAIEA